MRTFETGATRDAADHKLHYHGYIGWKALRRFGEYMKAHETQADGQRREPGNWKKGIPLKAYRDSLDRHVVDWNVAIEQEDWAVADELACAIWFNIQGWLEERMNPPVDIGL